MAVGIGADYGIYMSYPMPEELQNNSDERAAMEKAFKSAGKATLFVFTAVAGGFGVLMLSWGFMIPYLDGLFDSLLAMLVSSITALTLFPGAHFSQSDQALFSLTKRSPHL
jgi:predicted RND superfamily exporter protein